MTLSTTFHVSHKPFWPDCQTMYPGLVFKHPTFSDTWWHWHEICSCTGGQMVQKINCTKCPKNVHYSWHPRHCVCVQCDRPASRWVFHISIDSMHTCQSRSVSPVRMGKSFPSYLQWWNEKRFQFSPGFTQTDYSMETVARVDFIFSELNVWVWRRPSLKMYLELSWPWLENRVDDVFHHFTWISENNSAFPSVRHLSVNNPFLLKIVLKCGEAHLMNSMWQNRNQRTLGTGLFLILLF